LLRPDPRLLRRGDRRGGALLLHALPDASLLRAHVQPRGLRALRDRALPARLSPVGPERVARRASSRRRLAHAGERDGMAGLLPHGAPTPAPPLDGGGPPPHPGAGG